MTSLLLTSDEVTDLAQQYDELLAHDTPEVKAINNGGDARSHIRWMCKRIIDFAWEYPGKANRWIGFIQGYLWINGDHSLEELREHNKAYLVQRGLPDMRLRV